VLSANVANISDLVAAAASESGDEDEIGAALEGRPSLREWLVRESAKIGSPIRASAVLSAQWLATRRVSDAYVEMDFSANFAAIDDIRPQKNQQIPTQFRVDLVRTDEELSRIPSIGRLAFVCRPTSDGSWGVEVFSIDASGTARKLIASRVC
jgi:hypothetical protein